MPLKIFKQFITYNLVGIVNTLFGFSIIFLLMYVGVSATFSNGIGYAVGALLSYTLNQKYTFAGMQHSTLLAVKFFGVLFIAYLLNLMTLRWLLENMNPYLAQVGAGVVYTICSFLLAKFIVFKV